MPTRRQRSIKMSIKIPNSNAGDEQRIIRCAVYAVILVSSSGNLL